MIDLLDEALPLHSGAPWWLVRNGLEEPEPAACRPAEVVVVGAGLTGAMVADRLVNEGLDVLLIDRRAPGYGSTAVSTALVQYELDTHLTDLRKTIGARADHVWEISAWAVKELGAVAASLDGGCGYSPRPSLYLATSAAAGRAIIQEATARNGLGLDSTRLTAREVKRRYGFESHGALRTGNAAVIDPVRTTRAILARACTAGAGLMSRTNVTKVDAVRGGFVVRTDRGNVKCRQVVLAIGYEIPRALRKRRVTLTSTYAIATEPVENLGPLADGGLVWESRRPYHYLRTTDERRIIIGGLDVPFTSAAARDRLLPRQATLLHRRLRRMIPSVDARTEFAWAGTFASTTDGLPIIGGLDGHRGAWLALGYGGNGVTFAVVASRILADLCLGRSSRDAELFAY